MKTIHIIGVLALAAVVSPVVTSAATIQDLLVLASGVLNSLIPIFVTLALLAFFWGLILYIYKTGADGKAGGVSIMIYSLTALFVMVSVWGIIRLLQNTFKVTGNEPVVPKGIQLR